MNLDAVETFFIQKGPPNGFPVVLIHGFPFSHEMWKPQIEALSSRYRVVAYDLRGHGRTPAGDRQYTLEFFVDDLLDLMDRLKILEAALVGLSMGGYIALRAVERNPDRVKGLVLCDTRSDPDSNEAKIRRTAAVRRVKREGPGPFAEDFVKAVFAPETFRENPGVVDAVASVIKAQSPAGICGAQLALAGRTDATPALASIRVPALVLTGERDALTPPAVGKAMADRIPGAEFHVIPRAAHLSNLENPAEFNRLLAGFLAKIS